MSGRVNSVWINGMWVPTMMQNMQEGRRSHCHNRLPLQIRFLCELDSSRLSSLSSLDKLDKWSGLVTCSPAVLHSGQELVYM
mmetsp:Transcript_59516/g.141954  ORF Transcript_59516/g.141954 Transcript_59516/m.141954 type:complete len:82 (-) Transcript_59516:961-1206(-)